MKTCRAISLLVGTLASPLAANAQMNAPPPPPGSVTDATAAYRARGADDMQLKQYTWTTRVELVKSGALVDQIITQQLYLPNGRLQRTPINGESAPMPKGFLHRAAAQKKLEEIDDKLERLRDLVELYRPTAGALMSFLSEVKTIGPDKDGLLIASGKNVVKQGDSVTLSLNAQTKKLFRMHVKTSGAEGPVEISASFVTIPNGPAYLEYAEIDVPEQKAYLLIHSYNYVLLGQ